MISEIIQIVQGDIEDAKLRNTLADKMAKRMSFSIGSIKVESAAAEKPAEKKQETSTNQEVPIDIQMED